MSDDLLHPPMQPFYDERPRKRRRANIQNQRPEYYERKRRELAEQIAKPVGERVGHLRTWKSGDFTEEEVAALKQKYERKGK